MLQFNYFLKEEGLKVLSMSYKLFDSTAKKLDLQGKINSMGIN